MKKHYDFTKASQGEMFRPPKSLRIPIYLDQDVEQALVSKNSRKGRDVSKIVNDVLRTQLDMIQLLKR